MTYYDLVDVLSENVSKIQFLFSIHTKKFINCDNVITYSVLISYCFALYPYEKQELIKPE